MYFMTKTFLVISTTLMSICIFSLYLSSVPFDHASLTILVEDHRPLQLVASFINFLSSHMSLSSSSLGPCLLSVTFTCLSHLFLSYLCRFFQTTSLISSLHTYDLYYAQYSSLHYLMHPL